MAAQLELRPGRQASYPAPERYLSSSESSVSGLRAAILQSLRAHQAECLPRSIYESGPSLHRAAPRRTLRAKGRKADPL